MKLTFLGLLLIAAFIHVVGESIFKIGSHKFYNTGETSNTQKTQPKSLKTKIMSSPIGIFFNSIIILSFTFSLVARLIFGYVLNFNNLNTITSIYLGLVIIFSQVVGWLLFHETFVSMQGLGVILLISGIYLVGIY